MRQLLQSISRKRVLVVGDLMLDHYLWGDAERISPEAPVPVVVARRDTYAAGGAANVALNLRALGAETVLAGRFGSGSEGEQLRRILRDARVDLAEFLSSPDAATNTKTRVMCRNQQLCRIDREPQLDGDTFDPRTQGEELTQQVASADAVILSDYAKGVVSSSLIHFVLQAAHRHGTFVALDPKPRPELAFEGVSLLTPNRTEAMMLAGLHGQQTRVFPAEAVCERIHARYHPTILVVTLGGDGMLVSTEGRPRHNIPTLAREVFDVSGAGDTVIAALTAALVSGATIDQAAQLANVAAGIVVGKLGTATATVEEILSFGGEPRTPES